MVHYRPIIVSGHHPYLSMCLCFLSFFLRMTKNKNTLTNMGFICVRAEVLICVSVDSFFNCSIDSYLCIFSWWFSSSRGLPMTSEDLPEDSVTGTRIRSTRNFVPGLWEGQICWCFNNLLKHQQICDQGKFVFLSIRLKKYGDRKNLKSEGTRQKHKFASTNMGCPDTEMYLKICNTCSKLILDISLLAFTNYA